MKAVEFPEFERYLIEGQKLSNFGIKKYKTNKIGYFLDVLLRVRD